MKAALPSKAWNRQVADSSRLLPDIWEQKRSKVGAAIAGIGSVRSKAEVVSEKARILNGRGFDKPEAVQPIPWTWHAEKYEMNRYVMAIDYSTI